MRSRRNPSRSFTPLQDDSSDLKLEPLSARSSTSVLSHDHDVAPTYDSRHKSKLLMVLPLAVHCLGSIALAAAVLFYLNDRQFYLERQPGIKLADGSYESNQLGKYNPLQSDITTILSGFLMVLRWVAGAWAVPLCWRAVFLLAERNGLRYRDIDWITNYGVLPPVTHFRRPFNLLLGLILLSTLAPSPASPLLTGAISWIPSSTTLELSYHPTINLTGVHPNKTLSTLAYSGEYHATFPTDVVKNFNTAWDQITEDRIFRRVIPSISHLNINSTVGDAVIPYFAVTKVEWIPKLEDETLKLFNIMRRDRQNFQRLPGKMSQPGAVSVIVEYSTFQGANSITLKDQLPSTWPVLINVAKELGPTECNSNTTFLPQNTTIPQFHLAFNSTEGYVNEGKLSGCFVYANVSYHAGSGHCRNCRIVSTSTVQNDTELEDLSPEEGDPSIRNALVNMAEYAPSMTPLKESLPDLTNGVETYVTSLLIRLYSALWTSWCDAFGVAHVRESTYSPAIPTLKAEVDLIRVYAWLLLQLLATVAGLAFLWLQRMSQHPPLTDTSMVAFDIDSTRVPKPNRMKKNEREEILRIEPDEDRWKVVIASARSSDDPK